MARHDPVDLHRVVAHVVQNHPLTPAQVGDMTPVELALYTTDTAGQRGDLGTTLVRLEALNRLTTAQRVELQRRLYA